MQPEPYVVTTFFYNFLEVLKFSFTANCEWELNVSVKKKKKNPQLFKYVIFMWIFQSDADGQKLEESAVAFVWFAEATVA